MADFDSYNYSIEKRLPEWWKGFGALEPVNKYSQEVIAEILQALLSTMGVAQPLNCWLTIPEEYTWYHHYKAQDDYLLYDYNGTRTNGTTTFEKGEGSRTVAVLPNTKRNCHAKIHLKLLGTDLDDMGQEIIPELIIKNANQEIKLHNVKTISTIEISTEDNEILIDGVADDDLIEGSFNKIKPTIKSPEYKKPNTYYKAIIYTKNEKNEYIKYDTGIFEAIKEITSCIQAKITSQSDPKKTNGIYYISKDAQFDGEIYNLYTKKNGEIINTDKYISITKEREDIDLEDENKQTEIIFESKGKKVNFDLQIYLKKPTYTTEQNIRVATVSAFPIESITLWGYFCHKFNNKAGYKKLWEKKYTEESRTTFDRITKQFDCERFHIEVKFYGIDIPLKKGFPQAEGETNPAYQPNPILDRWGKIYGLPRRIYKPDITEDEEPFTFPKYYPYPIEQDYWYEERMINEYCFNNEAVNALFIKDDEFNNIGMLECIYPFMDDIWVYTETVDPQDNKRHEIKDVKLYSASQNEVSPGVAWDNPQEILNNPIAITLDPKTTDTQEAGKETYRTKTLKCAFCLKQYLDELPEDITIRGLELKFETETSVQSQTIKLSDESKIVIPYFLPNSDDPFLEKVSLIHDEEIWMKEKGFYTLGGENDLFQEDKITKEQLFKGNDGKVEFELVFTNENNFLESTLYLKNISLNIYYEVIPTNYDINVSFNSREIDLSKENSIAMQIDIENKGDIKVLNKELFIVIPYELEIQNQYNSFIFNLDIGEKVPIEDIIIKSKTFDTGLYDILVFCEDKVISNEILIRGKGRENDTESD